MGARERNSGMFEKKGDSVRQVRTIRLTDACWEALGERAEENGGSRADYLEELVKGDSEGTEEREDIIQEIEDMLEELLEDDEVNGKGKQKGIVRRVHARILEALRG